MFGEAIEAREGAGIEPKTKVSGSRIKLEVERLMVSYLRQTKHIMTIERVKTKRIVKTSQEEVFCLLNSLAEPLGKSF